MFARWIPRILTLEHKLTRIDIFRTRYQSNPMNFYRRLITQDEAWAYHFEIESNIQSEQWTYPDSPPPKKKTASVSKVMTCFFLF